MIQPATIGRSTNQTTGSRTCFRTSSGQVWPYAACRWYSSLSRRPPIWTTAGAMAVAGEGRETTAAFFDDVGCPKKMVCKQSMGLMKRGRRRVKKPVITRLAGKDSEGRHLSQHHLFLVCSKYTVFSRGYAVACFLFFDLVQTFSCGHSFRRPPDHFCA